MKRRLTLSALGVALALSGVPLLGFAADHGDVPPVGSDATADITDLYAWMTDDTRSLNLVLNVNSGAGAATAFSPAVTYAVSISSSPMFGGPQQSTKLVCKFIDTTNIECWIGAEYVVGNPSAIEGIRSESGKLRVFAGRRDDPFFLEYNGFGNTIKTAVEQVVAGNIRFDNLSCPILTAAQLALLQDTLTHGNAGAPPSNTFAGQAVLSLVVQLDKTLVNGNGPVLGVWASTHSVR